MTASGAMRVAQGAGGESTLGGHNLVLNPIASAGVRSRRPPAAKATARRSAHRIAVQPFGNAAIEDQDFVHRSWEAADELRGPGSLVKVVLPVLSQPTVITRTMQCDDPDLAAGPDRKPHDQLLSFGTGIPGRAWLHCRCWSAWHLTRGADATTTPAIKGTRGRNPHP